VNLTPSATARADATFFGVEPSHFRTRFCFLFTQSGVAIAHNETRSSNKPNSDQARENHTPGGHMRRHAPGARTACPPNASAALNNVSAQRLHGCGARRALQGHHQHRHITERSDAWESSAFPERRGSHFLWSTDILPYKRRCPVAQWLPASVKIMKERFQFETDSQSAEFCEAIVNRMVSLFGITIDEAIGRLNQDWKGISITGPDDVIYHEDEDYWAKTIYYGKGSNWWLNPPSLKPRPYPN
jgi:hypothetical protein